MAARTLSILVSILWTIYIIYEHYNNYYAKVDFKYFQLDGILRKPYDDGPHDFNTFRYINVYPVRGQNQTDHGLSARDSNQRNIVSPRDHGENDNRPASRIVQCTEACTLDNQPVVVCNGQHIPRQLLNLPSNNDIQEPPLPRLSSQIEYLPSRDSMNASNNDIQEPPLPRLSSQIEDLPPADSMNATEIHSSTHSSNSIVGEFLTIMVEAMNEDDCLRTMLGTSRRTVYQTLFRIYQHYCHGSSQDAIREWFSLLGISVESGLHLNEGNLVLPAFNFSSVVHGICDNPDCPSPEERHNHVNIVLPWRRSRECDRQHTCILQNLIDHWFHTTQQCNASYRCNNPENFNATISGSGTCRSATCGGTRDRVRRLSSNDLPLVLPINIQGMQFSSSDEVPMHVDFNGARFRLAGVTFPTQEEGVQQGTSRIFGARRSFYHSGDSVHSEIPQEDPLNGVLSFVYYVIDTDAL